MPKDEKEKEKVYHGWILREAGGSGYKDYISVEWNDKDGRHAKEIGRGESGAAQAVEWWDKRIGSSIKLEPTLKGCYRVYTD